MLAALGHQKHNGPTYRRYVQGYLTFSYKRIVTRISIFLRCLLLVNSLPSSPQHLLSAFKRQWLLVVTLSISGLAASAAALFFIPKTYTVQTYLDLPYRSELVRLNQGRSDDSGLPRYTTEQVYVYFTKRLLSDGAMQRFFKETYLPAQSQKAVSTAAEQALFAHMQNKVLRVLPPPANKGRGLYSVIVSAPTGADAAQWTATFLAQVEQDAKKVLLSDTNELISLQIRNIERDWQERLLSTQTIRQDRLAMLGEALQVAQAIGQHNPQITRAQTPAQDELTSYMDGSQLFARGTKSLQAEIDVLKQRKDDAPFVDGLRAAEAKLNLLKEVQNQTTERDFSIYQTDGHISAPAQPTSPKSNFIMLAALMVSGCLGVLIALWREGLLQRWLREDDVNQHHPALAPVGMPTSHSNNFFARQSSRTEDSVTKEKAVR